MLTEASFVVPYRQRKTTKFSNDKRPARLIRMSLNTYLYFTHMEANGRDLDAMRLNSGVLVGQASIMAEWDYLKHRTDNGEKSVRSVA